MEQMNLLLDTTQAIGFYRFTPTAPAWLKIDDLVTRLPSTSQAFVAMWFNDATHAAYTDGIEPAIRDSGYRAVRIDKKEHYNKIDDEIIAEIRRSKFLVADFTCEKEKVRGGVYFEAGFAMGLGIPVIWTVAKESLDDVHFDTRQYNHIVWDTPETLRNLLQARIGAVIGDGPLKVLG
jgi:nucleoside 2-deoxyribosyltransferase